MKKFLTTILILLIVGVAFKSIGQKKIDQKTNGFVIKGKLNGLTDGTKIYLKQLSDTIAWAKAKGDTFILEGHLPQEKIGLSHFIIIDFKDQHKGQTRNKSILIHLDNSEISLVGSILDLSPWGITIKGSKVHEDLMELNGKLLKLYIDPINKVFKPAAIRLRMSVNNDSSKTAKGVLLGIWKMDSLLRVLRNEYILNWIKDHPNSLIVPWFIKKYFSAKKQSELEPMIYAGLSDRVKNSWYGLELKKKLRLSLGQTVPELNLTAATGELISLKNIANKNKLTLIDFWFSDCQPCVASFPEMKALYAKYRDKGLEIYGLSVDKKEVWLKELAKQNLPWLNVVDNEKKLYENLYQVSGFPTYFLINREGKILYKHVGGFSDGRIEPDLLEIIEEKLGK